ESRLRKDVEFLASDDCEGRGVGTRGINLAADYIAHEFAKAGLKPAPVTSSYFQPFTMKGPVNRLESPNTLRLRGPLGQEIELKIDEHFRPVGLSAAGRLAAPIVFLGYGATARDIAYDDFKDIDVSGKVVIILRLTPRADNGFAPFAGENNLYHAGLMTKAANADVHSAAAILFVNDAQTAKNADTLMDFAYTANDPQGANLPILHVRRTIVDAMLQSALHRGLREMEEDIDRDLKPRSALLPGWKADLQVSARRPTIDVKNVV